ncbi:hypothetical protein [Roseateles violae]|uniref:Uncharacterized protein n=1 Tax=Roseateles violae TaxID=3058042 RepID=A0ABT8DP63_9BURK|nr:hypothetical protein [Pelomonas sp. PFR6]MDN3920142.1 hypothetical protein [Pelomonas sp. PFR6]
MKRLLISLAAAAVLLPAHAQTANPNAKVDPKNNKVSKPVVEKPKEKLLSRDELRACMKGNQDNEAEAREVKAIETAYNTEHAKLLADKEELTKRSQELLASVSKIKEDRESLLKFGEEIKAKAKEGKADKDEIKKMQDEYAARAAQMDPRIDAANKAKEAYQADSKGFDARVEAHNKAREEISGRVDKHMDAIDDWKASCANKKYDEADEIAIKKELAAAGAK